MDQNSDFLQNIPEFSATISNIVENGFFTEFSCILTAQASGKLANLIIKGNAKIPLKKENIPKGIKLPVNVSEIIENIKLQIQNQSSSISYFSSECKNSVWNKWNKQETKILRPLGSDIVFILTVKFD